MYKREKRSLTSGQIKIYRCLKIKHSVK